jgi:hypothetical protein
VTRTFHLRLPFGMKRIGTREPRARGSRPCAPNTRAAGEELAGVCRASFMASVSAVPRVAEGLIVASSGALAANKHLPRCGTRLSASWHRPARATLC